MSSILEVKKYPEKILRVKCDPVDVIDDGVRSLLADMAFTMHAHRGIGLAASQIGINKQIAVVDIGEGTINLINPKIIDKDGSSAIEEGCLSLPSVCMGVKRSSFVKITALDENGKNISINADGILSTVIQHEIDHLNGILIIDYADFIKRQLIRRKLLTKKGKKTDENMPAL